ncbi:MAG TPA: serine/threonine-protein kinase, partial [Ramlibacter sp.]|nr:serine/threonine-protein kinase [Ramlibacter sp.]
MNPPEAQAQVPQAKHAPAARELLHESGTTRVFRVRPPDGPAMVCKQPLGPAAPDRLRHEARMLARLAGVQGVPKLLAGPHPSGVIAFEDQGGIPLPLALPRMGFDLPQVLSLALRLARIVAAMHRRGVLHQNINPANILLCEPQQEPLLIDFRLATTFAEGQPGFIHHRDIQGTLAYLAPEQTGRTGRAVDQRADLYSLGATLYEMATGQPPFDSKDALQLIHDHLVREPIAPAQVDAGVPRGLSDIILRLLAKAP